MTEGCLPGDRRHTVHKVGGTCMSRIDEVVDNVFLGDCNGDGYYNRIFVVSAYGGITDRLLEHKKTHAPGVFALYAQAEQAEPDSEPDWGEALNGVAEEMCRINARTFRDQATQRIADRFVNERVGGVRRCLIDLSRLCSYGHFKLEEHLQTVREMLAALGEVHSAHNAALLLRSRGIAARFVDLSGWREQGEETLDERIRRTFRALDLAAELPIVTGYAQSRRGLMSTFDRGYSEVTFSRIACLTGAAEAIIHKEYHLSSADPKIVDPAEVRPIGQTNYDVADQLSNMGMEAIHPRAAKGLRQHGIPLRIKHSFEPHHDGTVIADGYRSATPEAEIVTGRRAVYEVEIFDQDMVGTPGSEQRVLEQLGRFKVWSVAKNTNANTITQYIAAPLKQVRRCVAALTEAFPGAEVQTRRVSIVSVIGSNLDSPGLFARALGALDDAGIAVLGAHQPSRMVDMQFAVGEGDFEPAIRALHEALVAGRAGARAKRAGSQAA
jgi:aspartate kinase